LPNLGGAVCTGTGGAVSTGRGGAESSEFSTKGISYMQKPEKIYLHHPNIQYALNHENINIGALREIFFYNQTKNVHNVTYTDKGDFKLDDKFVFEIGGKNKTAQQIAGVPNSFIVSDDIETGYKNQIPLWMFGFLY